MKEYTLKLQLISPTLIGSGEGFGAVIDTDVVFDDVGLPFVPAKRIKGCLRDAATEVQEMFTHAKLPYHEPMMKNIRETFGSRGTEQSAPVYFSNLMLTEHAENHAWLAYFLELQRTLTSNDSERLASGERAGKPVRYDDILSREKIVETFTEVRQQTAIEENGVAKDTSLRTIRVLKKGLTFSGTVSFGNEADHKDLLTTLLLACANFRAFGTKRNRGFGEVQCALREKDTGKTLSIQERWEEIENYVPATI